MYRRCAWCGGFLGVADVADVRGVTFGICDPCAAGVIAEAYPAPLPPTRPTVETWLAPVIGEPGEHIDGHWERPRGPS